MRAFRKNAETKKPGLFFWYELVLLPVIALLVLFSGNILNFIKDRSITTIYSIQKTANIALEDVKDRKTAESESEEAEAGEKAENAGGLNDIETPEKKQIKKVFLVDDKLLIRKNNKLISFDSAGNILSERTLKGDNTTIVEYGDKYISYESKLGIIALLDSEHRVINEVKTGFEIEELKSAKERIFVKPLGKNSVIFLDQNLSEVGTVDMQNKELVLMEAGYESSDLICYNTEISSNRLISSVVVYNKNKKIIASLDLNDAVLLSIHSGKHLFLLSDIAIMLYSNDLKPLYEKAYDGEISLSYYDGEKLYFIMDRSLRAGGKELIVYDSSGEIAYLPIQNTIEYISPSKKYILIASIEKLAILNNKIEVLKELNFTEDIEQIDWIDENHFFIKSRNRLIVYKIN